MIQRESTREIQRVAVCGVEIDGLNRVIQIAFAANINRLSTNRFGCQEEQKGTSDETENPILLNQAWEESNLPVDVQAAGTKYIGRVHRIRIPQNPLVWTGRITVEFSRSADSLQVDVHAQAFCPAVVGF